jgi:hypothetical protein
MYRRPAIFACGVGLAVLWGHVGVPPRASAADEARLQPLKDRLDELESRRQALAAEARELPRRIDELRQETRWLARWHEVSFVLGNARSSAAVGIVRHDGEYRAHVYASGPEQVALAGQVAKRRGIVRVGTPQARKMAQQILATAGLAEGMTLPAPLHRAIEEQIWKTHRFVPVEPEVDEPKFAVYRDVERSEQRIGLLLGDAGQDQFLIQPASRSTRTVPRGKVRLGSAHAESGRDIISHLDEGSPFIDYCVLSVAHRVGTPEDEPGFVCLAVHVSLDGGAETPSRPQWQFTGGLQLDNGLFLGIQGPISFQSDQPQSQRKLQRQVEDQFYQRLVDLGLPVVEREHQDVLELERTRQAATGDRGLGDELDATHVMIIEVEATPGGRPYMNVRLVEVATSQVVWTASGRDTMPPTENWSRFALAAGRPFVANLRELPVAERGPFVESPRQIPIGLDADATRVPDEVLLIQEESRGGAPQLLRPLFGRTPIDPTIQVPLTPVESIEAVTLEQRYRYVIWQCAQRLLTPAGRIVALKPIGSEQLATVTFGSDQGLEPGQSLRVLRASTAADSQGDSGEQLLATMLRVNDVYDDYCTAYVGRSGLGDYWEDDEYQPRVGDLVVSRFEPRKSVAVFEAAMRDPESARERRDSKWDERNKQGQFALRLETQRRADAARTRVRDELRKGLEEMGLDVYQGEEGRNLDETCLAAWRRGARVAIGGYISPVSTTQMRYELQLVELKPMPDGKIGIGRVLFTDKIQVSEKVGVMQTGTVK